MNRVSTKTKKPAHKLKELIDSYPKNTNITKKDIATKLECSLDKVNRWYRDRNASITETDQFALIDFFGLKSISDLYQSSLSAAATSKPIKALQS